MMAAVPRSRHHACSHARLKLTLNITLGGIIHLLRGVDDGARRGGFTEEIRSGSLCSMHFK